MKLGDVEPLLHRLGLHPAVSFEQFGDVADRLLTLLLTNDFHDVIDADVWQVRHAPGFLAASLLVHQHMRCIRYTRSAFNRVIAHRLPAENEIPFLSASGCLTRGAIMDMDMRSAVRHGIIQRHVALKSLVQISSLSNIDGNPITVLGLLGINEIAWQRLECSVDGINLVLILVAGLPGPTDEWGRCVLCLGATTE